MFKKIYFKTLFFLLCSFFVFSSLAQELDFNFDGENEDLYAPEEDEEIPCESLSSAFKKYSDVFLGQDFLTQEGVYDNFKVICRDLPSAFKSYSDDIWLEQQSLRDLLFEMSFTLINVSNGKSLPSDEWIAEGRLVANLIPSNKARLSLRARGIMHSLTECLPFSERPNLSSGASGQQSLRDLLFQTFDLLENVLKGESVSLDTMIDKVGNESDKIQENIFNHSNQSQNIKDALIQCLQPSSQ